MIMNLHTHTTRCGHASGKDEEYVLEAIKRGLKILGFSCHVPYETKEQKGMRMTLNQMKDYFESLNNLKEKYKDQIEILIGFESEYIEPEYDWYQYLRGQVDYLILGPHLYLDYDHYSSRITKEHFKDYLNMLEAASQSGLFTYIAHPDIFLVNQKEFDEDCISMTKQICAISRTYNIPLEYNLEGLKDCLGGRIWPNGTSVGYPHPKFWEIVAKENVEVVVGIDAHEPGSINGEVVDIGLNNLKELGINYTKEIKIK